MARYMDLTTPIARVHPATLASRDSLGADAFVIEGERFRIVRSEAVPVGVVILDLGATEIRVDLDPVAN